MLAHLQSEGRMKDPKIENQTSNKIFDNNNGTNICFMAKSHREEVNDGELYIYLLMNNCKMYERNFMKK